MPVILWTIKPSGRGTSLTKLGLRSSGADFPLGARMNSKDYLDLNGSVNSLVAGLT